MTPQRGCRLVRGLLAAQPGWAVAFAEAHAQGVPVESLITDSMILSAVQTLNT